MAGHTTPVTKFPGGFSMANQNKSCKNEQNNNQNNNQNKNAQDKNQNKNYNQNKANNQNK